MYKVPSYILEDNSKTLKRCITKIKTLSNNKPNISTTNFIKEVEKQIEVLDNNYLNPKR